MPTENTNEEGKLQRLGERVRLGWSRPQSLTAKERELVRRGVQEGWQQERETRRKQGEAQQAEAARQQQAREGSARGQGEEKDNEKQKQNPQLEHGNEHGY